MLEVNLFVPLLVYLCY